MIAAAVIIKSTLIIPIVYTSFFIVACFNKYIPMPNAAIKAKSTPAKTHGFLISLNIDDNNTAVKIYLATSRNQSPIFCFMCKYRENSWGKQ